MNNHDNKDDTKLDAFLRGQRPRTPAAPAGELEQLMRAIAPPRRKAFRRTAPLWVSGFALFAGVAIWVMAPWPHPSTDELRVDASTTETFALVALMEPVGEVGDEFMLRDHPLSGLTEDEGEE